MEQGIDLPFENLGAQLRCWRRLRSVKQAALAEFLDVRQPTLSRWEAGEVEPSELKKARIRDLLRVHPDSEQDSSLKFLIESSTRDAHLVCDTTHALLAASPGRERQWRVAASDLIGRSLWRFRTSAIEDAERKLREIGWFESAAGQLRVKTERCEFQELTIEAGCMACTRTMLSDGRFARIVVDIT